MHRTAPFEDARHGDRAMLYYESGANTIVQRKYYND